MQPRFTLEQIDFFARNGYLIVRGLATDEVVSAIRSATLRDLKTEKQPLEYEAEVHYPGAPETLDAPGGHTVRRLKSVYGRDPCIDAWASGPEFQLEDNVKAADKVRCGWLYGLYKPPVDPKTGKTLDATLPVGQWNKIRLIISPDRCAHIINGVTYFEYVLGSDDFKQRVKNSKFGRMPLFAKSDIGFITLQGDHGQVSFRNIKIRPIQVEK